MSEELDELKERAEHAKEDPSLVPVTVSMAVLAVLVAVVTLLGHRAHTEEVVLQAKSSDQWAYYQAKNIRRHTDEFFTDLTSVTPTTDAAQLAKLRDKYSQEAERYKNEQKDIEDKAHEMEVEVASERNRADRYDLAEVFLEVGLVITSITLLSGRKIYWAAGLVLAAVGIVVAVSGFLVH
jgi:CRISPR/Cas system CSM-associated protein Csm2 small subunit